MTRCSTTRSSGRWARAGRATSWSSSTRARPGRSSRPRSEGPMRCPVCHAQNFEGDDFCANCGADLTGNDVPEQATAFHSGLLGTHLDELGAPEPETIEPGSNVADAI